MNGVLLGLPSHLSPYNIRSNIEWYLLKNIGLTLLTYDEKDKLSPLACESWGISDDRMTYTFFLRKGLRDSEGNNIYAEDWVRMFRGIFDLDIRTQVSFVNGINKKENIFAKNEYEFVIQLDHEMPGLLHRLTTPEFILFSSKQEINSDSISDYHITTGGYFVKNVSNDYIILESNKYYLNYSKDQPEKIKLYKAPQNAKKLVELYNNKKIDFSLYPLFPFDVNFRHVNKLIESKTVLVADTPLQSSAFMILNTRSKIFRNKMKRKCFLNKWQKERLSELNTLFSKRNFQLIPQGYLGFSQKLNLTPVLHDQIKSFNENLTVIITPVIQASGLHVLLSKYFKKNNLEVKYKILNYSEYLDNISSPNNDIALLSSGMNVRDIAGMFAHFFSGKNNRTPMIYDQNDYVESKLKQVSKTKSTLDKHKMIEDIQKYVLEEALIVPLMSCEPNILLYTSEYSLPSNYNRKDKFLLNMFRNKI